MYGRTAAPFATERKDEKDSPAVKDQLVESRRRPGSASPYRSSTGSTPFGTSINFIPVSPRIDSPGRSTVRSDMAPWTNPQNLYDQAKNGKRTALEKYERPDSARERRRTYGEDLRAQIKARDSDRARNYVENQMQERRISLSKSISGLTRGLGERKQWV
eukprot:CAMPEP_0196573440 /NCGR_PEP_ID=MMETSP1081-20130531/3341_1 /TAXON_ID=36882 /ORGANISM="Pyramimonas amylifera, Strain CCMP720" /LENGTH=159 /DNA_ID=CAMNT_0041891151 /DNA_START=416 /DNA_END=895 /DNA_ORIENTATION=+